MQPALAILMSACSLAALGLGCVLGNDELVQARTLFLKGKYAEAIEIYSPLAEKDAAALLGLARCLRATGKADLAAEKLAAAADQAPLHAELARLAFERGDYPGAAGHADRAIELDGDQLLAHWIRAELDRVAGRIDKAEAGYRWLVRYYNAHPVKDAESLRWIGLGAARYARWNRLNDQFSFLVNELYADALQLDADFWPAHYESGLLFLEKYNQADAAREFAAALAINPQAAEVYAAVARLAVLERNLEKAEQSIERALQINPRLLTAWQGKADMAWSNFQTRETLELLEKQILPLNPASEATQARMAACCLLLDGGGPEPSPRLEKLIDESLARNPHCGEFFFVLASQLEDRNKFRQAGRYYRRAIEVMPQLLGPRSQLALLQMRTGEEAAARRMLDEAFEADPFNVRVSNMLEVLEVLDGMETLDTGEVLVRYDRRDELLARYVARYLEENYGRWCREFGYRPPGKPLLEIFHSIRGVPGQQWFSTRMIGLPYLGVVAASTGPVVAMASPNEAHARREFNWAQVVRHEFVHVITLQQTDYDIPHWYTEGLAVYLEGGPRPEVWNKLLLERVAEERLFDLSNLNFGFTRAQSGADWQMAYCQAELYVEYVLKRWGRVALKQLLGAYAEGLDTEEAISRVFEVSLEQFERGYRQHLDEVVEGLSSLDWPQPGSFEERLKARESNPQDARAAAELAYAYLLRGAGAEARQVAQQAVELEAGQPLATYVLARLQVKAGRSEAAVEMLEGRLDEAAPHPCVLNLLAALKLKAEHYDEAARLYTLGERLDPVNLRWTKALAKVCVLSGDTGRLGDVLRRLAAADPDDLAYRKKLAQMALDRRDYRAAVDWANQGLEIDVMDAKVHRMAGDAYRGLQQYAAAIEEYQAAVELQPDDPQGRFALADAYLQTGQLAEARRALEVLLQRVPDYPGADVLLESLKERDEP